MTLGLSAAAEDGPGEGSGELPAGWARATLGELAVEVQPGFASGKHNRDGDGIVHLRPMNITRNGAIDLSDARYVMDESDRRVECGDVVFNNTNSPALVGKTAWFGSLEPAAYSNHMTRLRAPEGFDNKFLAVQLHWLWVSGYFKTVLNNHVNQASVARKVLLATEIVVPPHPEQLRIVAEVEQQISRIEAGEAAASTALSSAATLAEQVTGLGSRGCLEEIELFPAPLQKADIDDGPIPDLPVGWKWARLGQVASVAGGVTKDSKRQGDPDYVEVPYLRVANVQRGEIVLDKVTTICVPPEKAEALRLERGDVLLNEGGDRDKLGRGWVWDGQIDNCIHQNHVFRARVIDAEIHPKLLAWHANGFGKSWCDRNGTQSVNLASISLRKIKLLPVPIPPREIQEELVKTIEVHLAGVAIARAMAEDALARAQDLRASLLHAAFTGALVPQDPADEPASALLDRIRAVHGAKAPRKRAARKPRPTPPGQEELPS
ncbi:MULTISPECIES: restriction endonuclease subunit S [Streptomyces]|uniref:restriction endonuclease subunit S n=1 Tax=Streptomyces TaxID=1883 RepID=UPI001292202F|nr:MULTISPECIES: restriction endonuclease subunit S [Streptomyces]MCX5037894.1 restriction endonuclease subunit S [Streptomyces coelicoflavus]QFX83989.1 restriction endonuclease subunit S [Streptomyces sp. SYP-A7193]